MVDTKHPRRLSKIVHDHKGNAKVEWVDAPGDYERQVLEISIRNEDSHNPYTHIPQPERKRAPGQRTDLRKLSAWIKMMRALEEAKKTRDEDG
jgi:hypothetical protein